MPAHNSSSSRQSYSSLTRPSFIQAEHSQSPLDCTKDVFLLLLSFHQVMPRFLDLIFGFGPQPSEAHYTAFHHEDFLSEKAAKRYEIPVLGRSGRQIRHCYNLWSVEKSDSKDGTWPFRQTAVYHSFDIDKHRAFWINVKANELMRDRIQELETAHEEQESDNGKGESSVLARTFATHLVVFDWCCENWRAFLAQLERDITEILQGARHAPLSEMEKITELNFEVLWPRSPTTITKAPTFPRRKNTTSWGVSLSRQSTGAKSFGPPERVLTALSTKTTPSLVGPALQPALQSPPKQLQVLKEFPVKNIQRLGAIGTQLQEAALIMKINAEVMGAVAEHYARLMESDEFPAALRSACKRDSDEFGTQVQTYVRSLESEQSRIITLLGMLDDGKKLFDTVLQFKNMEVSKLFQVNAHELAENAARMTQEMGQIAERTERETASMHIVTLVTLVFLPGTFVAVRYWLGGEAVAWILTSLQTLFGSGLFQWNQNTPEQPFPSWRQQYFNLFAKICFPMMACVILVWYLFYLWTKHKEQARKQRAQGAVDLEAQQLTEEPEKIQHRQGSRGGAGQRAVLGP